MKKTLLLPLFLFLYYISNAQMDKGTYLLGGQIYYNKSQRDGIVDHQNTNVMSGIFLGKAFKQNSFLGIHASYTNQDNIYTTPRDFDKGNEYSLGLFLRKYKPLGGKFFFFYQVDADVLWGNGFHSSDQGLYLNSRSTGARTSANAGFALQIYKRLQLEITFNNLIYASYYTSKYPGNDPATNITAHETNIATNLSYNGFVSNLGAGFNITL